MKHGAGGNFNAMQNKLDTNEYCNDPNDNNNELLLHLNEVQESSKGLTSLKKILEK